MRYAVPTNTGYRETRRNTVHILETNGVIERAGDDGLGRLWSSVEHLPTPNEVDAPGLWLARIEYN